VQVHKFISSGTLEERIDALIESKSALADNVIGGDSRWITELSTDDLRDLIELREEALESEEEA
jgi:SNF2 family DNA or RNA helicase